MLAWKVKSSLEISVGLGLEQELLQDILKVWELREVEGIVHPWQQFIDMAKKAILDYFS